MELNDILKVAMKGGASDIHLKAGLPPMFRIDGKLMPLKDARRLPPEEIGNDKSAMTRSKRVSLTASTSEASSAAVSIVFSVSLRMRRTTPTKVG